MFFITPPVPLQQPLNFLSKLMPRQKDGAPERYSRLGFQRIEQENFVSMPPYIVISYSDQTRLKTIVELLNATKYIEESPQVASPILIPHGASNRVTDPQVSLFLYDNSNASTNDKTLKLYQGGYHSILEGGNLMIPFLAVLTACTVYPSFFLFILYSSSYIIHV